MGLFSRDIKTKNDLFVHALQDIYYAERQVEKSLPKMAEKASDPSLQQLFRQHLTETQGQIRRLEQVFEQHGEPVKGSTCEAIDGILKESEHLMGNVADAEVLDMALVFCAQAVEHYEMTRYGSLATWADEMGKPDCAALLRENLAEEEQADKLLTAVALGSVNRQAA